MSTRSTLHPATRRVSLALAFAALSGVAACAATPTDPVHDGATAGTAEPVAPRLDGGDTTQTGWCGHTQGWEC